MCLVIYNVALGEAKTEESMKFDRNRSIQNYSGPIYSQTYSRHLIIGHYDNVDCMLSVQGMCVDTNPTFFNASTPTTQRSASFKSIKKVIELDFRKRGRGRRYLQERKAILRKREQGIRGTA